MTRISLLLAALLVLPPAQAGKLPFNVAAPGFPEDLLSQRSGSAAPPFNLKGQPAIGLEQARGGEGRGGGGRRGERGGGRLQRANTGMNRAPRSFDRGNRKPSGGWSRDTVNRRDRARPSLDRTAFDRKNFDRSNIPNRRGDGSNRQALQDRMANGNRDRTRDRMANFNRDNLNSRRDQLRDRTPNAWDRSRDKIQNGWSDRRTTFNENRDKLNDRRTTFNENRDKWNDGVNDRRDRFNDNINNLGQRVDRAYDRYDNYWPGWARPGWNAARPWNWGWYGGWSTPPRDCGG